MEFIDLQFISLNEKSEDELAEEYKYFNKETHGRNWNSTIVNREFKPYNKNNIFELGTGIGYGTMWMANNLCLHPESVIYTAGIDPKPGIDAKAKENLEPFNNVKYFNKYGNQVMRELGLTFDLIYIDGTHKYLSVLNDAKFSLQYLKDTGIIIFDDYSKEWPDVVKAVDEFVNEFKLITKPIGDTQIMVRR